MPTTLLESRNLTEAATPATGPGRLLIRLIDAGWGSSGFYGSDVLERAAADKVWPAGTHMYIDHPSLTAGIVALSIALYYGAARWLELRWPAFGYLLGTRAEPTYPASAVVGHVEVPSGFAALPRRDLSPEDVAQLASLAAALDEGDPARAAIEALGVEAAPYVPRHAASSTDD